MKTFFSIIKNILIGLNQTLNCCIRMGGEWGTPDEMISARAWRLREIYPKPRIWLDRLFFWDKNHTEESYKAEKARRDLPNEYQKERD